MQFNFEITEELCVLGGGASIGIEFLRGLLLNLENYPRLKANWRYFPSLFGMLGILLFPSAVPHVSSLLMQLAHGAISPIAFVYAYPQLEKLIQTNAKGEPKGESPKKEEPHEP